ncbi:MAG: endonuclease [Synergistales bacterium]|nr:endonuclease [Synergistales bacterium]
MILGIDPGISKTGWAFTDQKGLLLCSGIWTGEMVTLAGLISGRRWSSLQKSLLEGSLDSVPDLDILSIVIGRGTSSESFVQLLHPQTASAVKLIDESYTTLEARRLYWKIHEPGISRKIFPFLCQLIPRDIDDLAAWAIVLRYLQERSG